MNKEQKALILHVISVDAKIKYRYSRNGEECIIGGLAIKAGIKIPEEVIYKGPISANRQGDNPIESAELSEFSKEISEFYGITIMKLGSLQSINDEFDDIKIRRINLIRKVHSW